MVSSKAVIRKKSIGKLGGLRFQQWRRIWKYQSSQQQPNLSKQLSPNKRLFTCQWEENRKKTMLTKTMVTKKTSSPHERKQETHKNATSKTKKPSPAHERARQVGHDKKKLRGNRTPPPKKMQPQETKKKHFTCPWEGRGRWDRLSPRCHVSIHQQTRKWKPFKMISGEQK